MRFHDVFSSVHGKNSLPSFRITFSAGIPPEFSPVVSDWHLLNEIAPHRLAPRFCSKTPRGVLSKSKENCSKADASEILAAALVWTADCRPSSTITHRSGHTILSPFYLQQVSNNEVFWGFKKGMVEETETILFQNPKWVTKNIFIWNKKRKEFMSWPKKGGQQKSRLWNQILLPRHAISFLKM